MRRILVTGSTGAGKSRMARAIARHLAIPFHEMDALAFAGPGWRENEHLVEDVSQVSSGPCWVFDSLGYPRVRDLLWSRADTVVWLDYSRAVVMRRVLRRSAARTLLRRRIFGGNIETLASWLSPDHPARWAWARPGPTTPRAGPRSPPGAPALNSPRLKSSASPPLGRRRHGLPPFPQRRIATITPGPGACRCPADSLSRNAATRSGMPPQAGCRMQVHAIYVAGPFGHERLDWSRPVIGAALGFQPLPDAFGGDMAAATLPVPVTASMVFTFRLKDRE
jgi:adenylate kinase family enzyme